MGDIAEEAETVTWRSFMKKIATLLTALALVSTSSLSAQTNSAMGKGAAAGQQSSSDDFAWGIAFGGLAVLGVIVTVVAVAASDGNSVH